MFNVKALAWSDNRPKTYKIMSSAVIKSFYKKAIYYIVGKEPGAIKQISMGRVL